MALSILDGNQSATTLSTILSSGQHITAHTVVSLGTQAITDMRGAVSGSVVSISNLPSTQTIAGTVTANAGDLFYVAVQNGIQSHQETNGFIVDSLLQPLPAGTNRIGVVTIGGGTVTIGAGTAQIGSVTASISGTVPVSISSVTVGNSVTISSLPSLVAGTAQIGVVTIGNIRRSADGALSQLTTEIGTGALQTVIGSGTAQIGSVTASISNSVTIASLPAISGTVTANTFALQGTAVTTSNFTSTTASTVLASFNATREVLTIFNEGAGNLHICAGATCTTIAYQVRLSAGDYYEVPNHQTTITHSAVFATAGTARVTQVS
jgi:hypothetical protein